jgi:predicted permease
MNITLPNTAVSDIGGEVTSGLSTYAPVITLLVGIFVAFFVIEFIIGLLRHKKENEE